jgi:hypothetical protein
VQLYGLDPDVPGARVGRMGAAWLACILTGQCPKPITQHSYPKTAAPRIDPAQDLVARPNEKSGAENYFESHTYLIR